MSTAWRVRPEGSPTAAALPSAQDVLDGVRDGLYAPTDEVRGPADTGWRPIEVHPAFADAVADLDDPPPPKSDETHLDMNPLIDVCLVLLIFFILTITYESLRRSIEVPPEQSEEKGSQLVKVRPEDIKDRVFKVTGRMEGNDPVVKVEDKTFRLRGYLDPAATPEDKAAAERQVDEMRAAVDEIVKTTGRREMLMDVDGQVPWGVQTAVLDAAKGAGVHNILQVAKKRR